MSDPNAKAGLTEMLAIAKERDLAAMLIVHSANQMEFAMHLNASWSCAWVEPDEGKGMQLRIKSKLADYPSKEAQQKAIEATVGMVLASVGTFENWAKTFLTMGKMLGEKLHIEHMNKEEEQTKVKLGPTGKFPEKPIHPDDRGELASAIAVRGDHIVIEFGTSVKWLAMSRNEAEELIQRVSKLLDKLP